MMEALIIKRGALGDVLRTTPVVLPLQKQGYRVSWLTSEEALPLIPTLFAKPYTDKDAELLASIKFDLILSLDEEIPDGSEKILTSAEEVIGVVIQKNKRTYTKSSRGWYQMSLLANNIELADRLKYENRRSYQEILFEMIGEKFDGQPYILPPEMMATGYNAVIGIEARAGKRWPTKEWNKYAELEGRLKALGVDSKRFAWQEQLKHYSHDIGNCRAVVTGDTLALHFAIAHRLPVVALFTCTSPWEIYDYHGRVKKIISPKLEKGFYKTKLVHEAADAITTDQVMKAVLEQIL
jgi:heptosyltransferase-2